MKKLSIVLIIIILFQSIGYGQTIDSTKTLSSSELFKIECEQYLDSLRSQDLKTIEADTINTGSDKVRKIGIAATLTMMAAAVYTGIFFAGKAVLNKINGFTFKRSS